MICNICPHRCDIKDDFHGICRTRAVKEEVAESVNTTPYR